MNHMRQLLVVMMMVLGGGLVAAADEAAFRPTPGAFPPLAEAKLFRGELVFVDHINRRGSLRLHIDGHFHEGRLHHFAMLPYGSIRYRGAPASLQDIPLGTELYGRFYLPPDPETSAVPVASGKDVTQPAENHAILLEDGPSLCLREGKAWKLRKLTIKGTEGELVASLARGPQGDGLDGEHTLTVDGSTRIWRGRELLSLADLVADGSWPAAGSKPFPEMPVQLALGWHPRYLYQQFHVSDLWLDETAMAAATARQRGRHRRHMRLRWLPAVVEAVEHDNFGPASVTLILFGGMDEALYADFKPGGGAQIAAAEETLRTWWPNHDGMDGRITAVDQPTTEPPLGSSGIRVTVRVPLVLEGFRPGRTVRIRSHSWPKVKPPYEELVRGLKDRWPSPELFTR